MVVAWHDNSICKLGFVLIAEDQVSSFKHVAIADNIIGISISMLLKFSLTELTLGPLLNICFTI